jgi:hypothetical protein
MRYFLNTSAARPAVAGGITFEFEPVGLRGGSWLGILALDEPGASILAEARWPNTDEITEKVYQIQKKKLSANRPSSLGSPQPNPPQHAVAIADRAGSLTSRAVSDQNFNPGAPPAGPLNPNSISGVSAVSLMTTDNSPPAEPLLSQAPKRRKF